MDSYPMRQLCLRPSTSTFLDGLTTPPDTPNGTGEPHIPARKKSGNTQAEPGIIFKAYLQDL